MTGETSADPPESGVANIRPISKHVVLVGLMGCGKSAVGELVARHLSREFHDSDVDIQARLGKSVRDLQASRGIGYVHRLERRHLLNALGCVMPTVIAAAASTIEYKSCRVALREPEIAVAWLTVPRKTHLSRLETGSHRPMLSDDHSAMLREQIRHRYPLFRSVNPQRIAVRSLDPVAVANLILERIAVAPRTSRTSAPRPGTRNEARP